MIKISEHKKKNRKGSYDATMRIRGTLFGNPVDKILTGWDETVANVLETLINQLAGYIGLGALPAPHLQQQIRDIKEVRYLKLLEELELIPAQMKVKDYTIGTFLEDCLEKDKSRVSGGVIENSTLVKRTNACKKFLNKFGRTFDIRNLDYEKLDRYFRKRIEEHSRSLVQGELRILKRYFKEAIQKELIYGNPFDGVVVELDNENIAKKRILIPAETLQTVEDWLKENRPNDYYVYWILVRWTGARKNEPLHLTWQHIDFDSHNGIGSIQMPSPKTKKKGKPFRLLPMFVGTPVREVLKAEFERQKKLTPSSPSGYVVRDVCKLSPLNREKVDWDRVNPNTNLKRLIEKAGVKPWVKTCQNLRVTRENELINSAEYRSESVHQWVGHTRKTFEASYATIDPQEFTPLSLRKPSE